MLTPADQLEVEELMARYCWANDAGDVDAFVNLFTSDGLYESHDRVARGHAEIREVFAARVAARSGQPIANPQHWVTNLVVTAAGGSVHARSYFTRVVRDVSSGQPKTDALGWFDDQLRRDRDGWRFARRIVRRDIGEVGESPDPTAVDGGAPAT